jgi:thioredoxin 1
MADIPVIQVSDDNFDEITGKPGPPVMVVFRADWSGPSKMMAPVVDRLALDYAGRVTFARMDVDANPITPARYGVRGIPTFLLLRDGRVQEQLVGVAERERIQKLLDKQLAST